MSVDVKGGFDYQKLLAKLNESLKNYVLDPSERVKKRLFWRDDMEGYATCKWSGIYGGSVASYVNNATVGAQAVSAFEGDYYLQVINTSDNYAQAGLTCGLATIPSGIHAAEIRWLKSGLNHTIAELFLVRSDIALTEIVAGIRYYASANKWRYYASNGAWLEIPDSEEAIHNLSWNYVKIVVDFSNNVYRRLVTTKLDIDLSSLNLSLREETVGGNGYSTFRVGAQVTANNPVFFDDARIYLDEED